SNTRDAAGYARNSFWVPPPAHSDSMFFIGNGVFGFSRDTVRVIRRDLYEPNETSPTRIDLETSRPFPGTILNVLLFLNPALSFEPLLRDVKQGADWYHLRRATTSATSGFSETRTRRTTSATRRTRSRFCSATSLTGPTWTRSRSRTPTTWTGFGSTSPAQAPSRSASGPPPGRSPQWTRATSI